MLSSSPDRSGPVALVALGSNLGDSPKILAEAMELLTAVSVRPLVRSSLWQSTPVDCPPGSPLFLNAAVAMFPRSDASPRSLLLQLQGMEQAMGRQRKKVLNEPRPLDLDLIAWGDAVCAEPDLILPHPRAHLRRFVLAPLAEVAPDFLLPGQRKTVGQLLVDLENDERVTKYS